MQRIRAGRTLADFPNEVRTHKARMLDLVHSGQVHDAYALVHSLSLPPDLRAAVKPFFTHFTAGRTTEIVTAYAVAEIVAALVAGEQRALPAQVLLDGEWLGLHAVIAAPVILALDGWEHVYPLELNAEEVTCPWLRQWMPSLPPTRPSQRDELYLVQSDKTSRMDAAVIVRIGVSSA